MSELFLKVVNMSISAGWLVLAVLILRLVLKRAPKWVNVLLWGIVAVRLLLPFSIESAVSLIPSAETISPDIMMDPAPSVNTGIPALNSAVNPVISQSFTPSPAASANPLQIWIPVFAIVWLAGVAVLLVYTAVSYWRLRRKVDTAVLLRDNIFQSENAASPFVLGVIRPRIYLPFNMDERDMENVAAHELAHISRRDHWWKPLGFLLLTVHWFNPLMWLAYVLLCRDIELACDERVIRELGNEQRADYTQALLTCSVSRRGIAACPLAFGEVGVKERVKSVMNYKKPAFWVAALAVIACAAVAVCFLTDPTRSQQICVDGVLYVQSGDNISKLPDGSSEIGTLKSVLHHTNEHPTEHLSSANLNEKYAGCLIYQSGAQKDVIYLEDFAGFYIPFVCNSGMETRKLTLDDVVMLSQKGGALTWSDFERFDHFAGGNGLYQWVFAIEDPFQLMVGGSPDTAPKYVYLQTNDGASYIDIRDGGVEEYIALHKDNPLVIPCTAGWQCSYVGYSEELFAKMAELGGISKRLQVSSIQYLPVVRVDSTEELREITELMSSYVMSLDYSPYPDMPAFSDAARAYDDSFFETSTLFLIYTTEPMTGVRYSDEYVTVSDGTLSIGIQRQWPEAGNYAMEGWLIAVSVPTAQITGAETVEARISSQYYPDEWSWRTLLREESND